MHSVAQALSESIGQSVAIKSTQALGGGCINHASKIETSAGNFFLKWNNNCAADIFLREAESLTELKKAAGDLITIPRVMASKKVDELPGFLVLEFVESNFSHADHEKLGRGLAMIHRFENRQFGFYSNNYCGDTLQLNSWKQNWTEFFRDNRLFHLLKLIQNERPFAASEYKIFEKLLSRIDKLIPESSIPVLIHGDLWSGNFMMSEKGPVLIDPAAYYANREMEFGIITMFGGFTRRFFDSYNEINPLPEDWKERNPLYQLYHVLNHYYLFGGGYRSQALLIAGKYI